MSARIDKTWVVLESVETDDGLRCVDFFRRHDGSFGCEEFRRDPEDRGAWTPVRFASGLRYEDLRAARGAAHASVAWFADVEAAREQAQ
jgi:hypothetical protein